MKWKLTEWEKKIFSNDMTNKGFTSKIYDQLIQLNIRKKAQLKNEKDTWIDSFPTGTLKDAQHLLSGKWKSEWQWDITWYMPEWLSSKRTHITNDGEDVGKRKPLVKMEIGAATVGNLHSMKVSQKTNNRIILRSSSSTTECILKKILIQ